MISHVYGNFIYACIQKNYLMCCFIYIRFCIFYNLIQIESISFSPDLNAGNQPKMLKKIVAITVDRKLLSNFTWSGKSIGGQKKLALQSKEKVVDLLYKIAKIVDPSYSRESYLKDLKNKVLKYAYEYVSPF